jgi:hypothetical protein
LSSWAARRADWRWAGARRRKGEGGRQAAGEKKWAEPERRRGRGNAGRGGERKGWAKPKSGREREMSFSNFPIYVLLKYFEKKSKTNLKRKTSHTKIHAAA